MAWRETRAAWRHFVYFVFSIAVGVGALVTVAVFASNVEQTVTREARGLLGGDLEVRTSRPLNAEGAAVLSSLSERGYRQTHVSELIAMTAVPTAGGAPQSGQGNQLVELKAVEAAYPLYGAVSVEPSKPLSVLLASDEQCGTIPCPGAVVQQSLLIRLGLRTGDALKIGAASFVIRGILTKEPDRMANAFSLGPRVMISQEGLRLAELVKPGSRVRERYLIRMERGDPQLLVQELRGRLATSSARVSSFREAQPQLKRFLEQLTRYLGLVGLTALFVGGIGVATTVHAFIREKLQSIAILKTLGAGTSIIVGMYVVQAVLLASVGSLLGSLFGLGAQHVLPGLLRSVFASDLLDQLGFTTQLNLATLLVVSKGLLLGILTALLFTLWPVLKIRDIRPSVILRRVTIASEQMPSVYARSGLRSWRSSAPDAVRWGIGLGILLGLTGLAIWQAGSWRVGLVYLTGLLGAVMVLNVVARWLISGLQWLPPARSLVLRYAIRNIYRPGSQAVGVMMAVGLALTVIVSVSLMERALVEQVASNRPEDAPTFFFIDIQPDQKEGVLEVLQRHTGARDLEAIPLLRSRLVSVNGDRIVAEPDEDVAGDRPEERRRQWYQTREYVLTMLDGLPKDNVVVQGKWWKPGDVFDIPRVSIEEEAARHLGLEVGSRLAVDIQGAIVEAEVSSVRKVEWGNLSTNFYMIFSPGSLEGAPFTYVATVRTEARQDVPLLRELVARYPNVTGIHMGDVLEGFARMLDRLALAIRAVAVFSLVSGALVMATALSATRYRRLYESVILKALGGSRGLILRAFASEYALLGFIAGLAGLFLANLLSWGLLSYLFDLAWSFQPELLMVGLLLTTALTVAVGFFGTFGLLGRRPLAVLRYE
ncbi:ABC transporter permease [Nitrospira sp.]|nr:ABC transporter permease [Nitrospira sp.]